MATLITGPPAPNNPQSCQPPACDSKQSRPEEARERHSRQNLENTLVVGLFGACLMLIHTALRTRAHNSALINRQEDVFQHLDTKWNISLLLLSQKGFRKLFFSGVLQRTYNSSPRETEAEGSPRVHIQVGLCSEFKFSLHLKRDLVPKKQTNKKQ